MDEQARVPDELDAAERVEAAARAIYESQTPSRVDEWPDLVRRNPRVGLYFRQAASAALVAAGVDVLVAERDALRTALQGVMDRIDGHSWPPQFAGTDDPPLIAARIALRRVLSVGEESE